MTKITKRLVDALKPGDVLWEHRFGVRGNADGTKSYLLDYRVGHRRRRLTIGTHGAPWTVDTARKRAHQLLHGILSGGTDPLAAKASSRAAVTVRELADRFLTEHWPPSARRPRPGSTVGSLTRSWRQRSVVEPSLTLRAVTWQRSTTGCA